MVRPMPNKPRLAVLAAAPLCAVAVLALARPGPVPAAPPNQRTRAALDFLRTYDSLYLGLTRVAQEAQWVASTDVSDAHEGERTGANTAMAAFQGDKTVIEITRDLLR